jgi:hypothetical protein
MDDLAGKISELLNNPETMDKIKGLSGLLGQPSPPAQKEPIEQPKNDPADASLFPADTLQTVMKLAPLFSSLNQEDDSTRLLHALRPMLGEPRRRRLDEAAKMLQLMRLLPLLKNNGIL